MKIKEVANGILLDCDVLVAVGRSEDQRLNGVGLEVTFVPVNGSDQANETRTSRLFIRRKQAEELFELLREALKKPESRTLN